MALDAAPTGLESQAVTPVTSENYELSGYLGVTDAEPPGTIRQPRAPLTIAGVIFWTWLQRAGGSMEDTVHLAFVAVHLIVLGFNVMFFSFIFHLAVSERLADGTWRAKALVPVLDRPRSHTYGRS